MAFESLTERLQNVFKNLRKKGKISESDVQEATKEIRLALLEADVALPVVKDFIKKVRERAVGHEVIDTLNPAQHWPLLDQSWHQPRGEFRLVELVLSRHEVHSSKAHQSANDPQYQSRHSRYD